METLVVFALVVLGAAAFVVLGVFLASRGGKAEATKVPEVPRRRRWPRILGGVSLAIFGALTALASCGGWVTAECENSFESASWPLESRGNAVVLTSAVLEFESGTFGWFCENDRTLVVRARARPSTRKAVFVGAGGVAATRRYLAGGQYEVASTYLALLKTRRVGEARPLEAPVDQSFWRADGLSSGRGPGMRARIEHEWRAVGAEPFSGLRFGTPPSERFWLVVMNADGSPGLDADFRFEVELAPRTRWPWLIGIGLGVGLAVAGVVLAVRRPGVRSSG